MPDDIDLGDGLTTIHGAERPFRISVVAYARWYAEEFDKGGDVLGRLIDKVKAEHDVTLNPDQADGFLHALAVRCGEKKRTQQAELTSLSSTESTPSD